MPRCSYCRAPLDSDRDKVGARCPHCRRPLYEDPRDPHQPGRYGAAAGACVAHPANPSVGACRRCGNFLCSVCRTSWRGQVVCAACVARALEAKEAPPVEARAHFRQAVLGLVLGLAAWATAAGAVALMAAGAASGPQSGLVAIGFGVLLLFASPLPGLLGVGQATAAIRARGDHMILATIGLLLSGLHTGVLVGVVTALFVFPGRG